MRKIVLSNGWNSITINCISLYTVIYAELITLHASVIVKGCVGACVVGLY